MGEPATRGKFMDLDPIATDPRCPFCGNALSALSLELCPECGQRVGPAAAGVLRAAAASGGLSAPTVPQPSAWPGFLSLPPMRYPNAYTWLVLVSALDVMLTLLVLEIWEGKEVNPIAAAVIAHGGYLWAILLKFAVVVLVVVICEVVGRSNDRKGRLLAYACVGINSLPVVYTFALLMGARHTLA